MRDLIEGVRVGFKIAPAEMTIAAIAMITGLTALLERIYQLYCF